VNVSAKHFDNGLIHKHLIPSGKKNGFTASIGGTGEQMLIWAVNIIEVLLRRINLQSRLLRNGIPKAQSAEAAHTRIEGVPK